MCVCRSLSQRASLLPSRAEFPRSQSETAAGILLLHHHHHHHPTPTLAASLLRSLRPPNFQGTQRALEKIEEATAKFAIDANKYPRRSRTSTGNVIRQFPLNDNNMAAPTTRTLAAFQRATWSTFKAVKTPADVQRHPVPLLVPVRTKKRYFVPPAVGLKSKRDLNPEAKAQAAGVVFRQQYMERPINIACTAGIFDPYIPPEGDARLSSMSKEGLKQRTEQLRQSASSLLAVRKIKEFDSEFSSKDFAEQAQEIFIEAHNALCMFSKEKLHSLVTERCYPEMTRGNRYKTLHWRLVESLEAPRVVHARSPDMVAKGNLYGQVTVRMHSRQTLAIYDRFGRLMLGSEEQPKDVLEYLVMERHLVNPYGRWRLHGKIVPSWAPAKDPIIKTVMIPSPNLKPGEEFDVLNYQVPKAEAVQWSK
ncbi:39S ribosomal protein L45, mitochondrial isoform X2 [Phyllopteryx taeniolatus]|uniref:39S ribosomal protein L45, mitochondrial isoform X2 n=1 Tax=Phyllopteryx taeniolatus TaxID=161469 RepID=UPI002AD27950|nr:39S ribosomal protein L45, mitochondrial isoform X2 [Phyllopteryx taeniolatus]